MVRIHSRAPNVDETPNFSILLLRMFYLRNLCSSEIFGDIKPWDFLKTDRIPPICFTDKIARDKWINDPSTDFHVYSLYEGVQGNLRIRGEKAGQGDNPPFIMHGLAVDYDCKTTIEDVNRSLKLMGERIPNWFEQTLSGNGRLIWIFQTPLKIPSRNWLKFVLQRIDQFIPFDKLPGADKPALLAPERYFTNGCRWSKLSDHQIPYPELIGWTINLSSKFSWNDKDLGKAISLEKIAGECVRRYPRFSEWPGDFVDGSQGPSFWVEGSTSSKSAIVRETGMHTFSAHAHKAFFSWAEIVGSEFVEKTDQFTLGNAVEGIYYDGKNFVLKDSTRRFIFETKDNLKLILMEGRKLSDRRTKGEGVSPVEKAIHHILMSQRVDGASSCAFYPHGVFTFNGKLILNTHQIDALPPAPDSTLWGSLGKFPFLSAFFDQFFYPKEIQLERFLAWTQYFYRCCLNRTPRSGHGVFIAGPVGIGKSFLSRGVLSRLVGGCQEANNYLTASDNFNSELFDVALWVMDDASVLGAERMHLLFSENVKRVVANREHRCNEKFRKAVLTPWQGRIMVTLNNDPESLRLIPNLDISILEKLMLFRAGERTIKFFTEEEMKKTLDQELPHFARWLLDWTPPPHCFENSEPRFGLSSFCEETLARSANQSSVVNVFGEILQKWIKTHFEEQNPKGDFWEGSATDLRLAMVSHPSYLELLRPYRPESFSRMLSQLQSKRMLLMEVFDREEGRIFRIYRNSKQIKTESIPQAIDSKFNKT